MPWFSLADVWQIREANADYILETKEKVSELGLANSSARLLPAGTVMPTEVQSGPSDESLAAPEPLAEPGVQATPEGRGAEAAPADTFEAPNANTPVTTNAETAANRFMDTPPS